MSALEATAQTLPDAILVERKKYKQRLSVGKVMKIVIMKTIGNGILSVHKEIFVRAAETFGKIHQLLVEGIVNTLNEAFMDPLRTEQAMDVQMEVFGFSDKFLEMFVAPGAIKKLEQEYYSSEKEYSFRHACINFALLLIRSEYLQVRNRQMDGVRTTLIFLSQVSQVY